MDSQGPTGRWACAVGWVATAQGGCGPAVLLCAADAGAAPGACMGMDLSRPHPVGDPDAGGQTFFRQPDGAVGGAWSGPASASSAPGTDFAPVAGIPTCAPGWRRQPDGTCDPMMPTDCGAGIHAAPNGVCVPSRESDCAAGEWADVSAQSGSAPLVRVRAGASDAMADGSAARPYGTLALALTRAAADGWILLASGSYAANITVRQPVHIVGVCAARATFTSDAATPTITVEGSAAMLDLRGVTLTPGGRGLSVRSGAHARLTGVRVRGATARGIECTDAGSTLEVDRVSIDGTVRTGAPPVGSGLVTLAGARLTGRALVVSDSGLIGLGVNGIGTSVELQDSVVRTTQMVTGMRPYSLGVAARDGAALTLRRCVLDSNGEYAGVSAGAGSTFVIEDSVVRASPDGARGPWGLSGQDGARLEIRRVLFDGLHYVGASADGASAVVDIADSVVRGVVPWETTASMALQVSTGGRMTAARVRLEGNRSYGVVAHDRDSQAVLSDSVITGTLPRADGRNGIGVVASAGARVTLTAVRIERSTNHGVFVWGAGSYATLERSVIAETVAGVLAGSGQSALAAVDGSIAIRHSTLNASASTGIFATSGGSADVQDSLVGRSGTYAVAASGAGDVRVRRSILLDSRVAAVEAQDPDAHVTLSDCAVYGPVGPALPRFGRGLEASFGGVIDAERIWVEATQESGAAAWGMGSAMTLRDSIVTDSRPSLRGFGLGIVVYGQARAVLERTAVTTSRGAAVACVPIELSGAVEDAGQLQATDLFVRDVRTGSIQFALSGMTITPSGRSVAYGLHVSERGTLTATRATILAGGFGLLANDAMITFETGLIAQQLDAAGAWSGRMPALRDVARRDNASDALIEDRSLPTVAALPAPTRVEFE